jgi:hypothetical protein
MEKNPRYVCGRGVESDMIDHLKKFILISVRTILEMAGGCGWEMNPVQRHLQ